LFYVHSFTFLTAGRPMIGITPFMLPYKPQLIECSSSLYVLFIQRNCRFDHGY